MDRAKIPGAAIWAEVWPNDIGEENLISLSHLDDDNHETEECLIWGSEIDVVIEFLQKAKEGFTHQA
jgi:hypothetical protein